MFAAILEMLSLMSQSPASCLPTNMAIHVVGSEWPSDLPPPSPADAGWQTSWQTSWPTSWPHGCPASGNGAEPSISVQNHSLKCWKLKNASPDKKTVVEYKIHFQDTVWCTESELQQLLESFNSLLK